MLQGQIINVHGKSIPITINSVPNKIRNKTKNTQYANICKLYKSSISSKL